MLVMSRFGDLIKWSGVCYQLKSDLGDGLTKQVINTDFLDGLVTEVSDASIIITAGEVTF